MPARNLPAATPSPPCDDPQAELTRRQSLRAVAKYAAFVAPAMTVLVHGSATAAPNCDNPGRHLGISRHGHSGC